MASAQPWQITRRRLFSSRAAVQRVPRAAVDAHDQRLDAFVTERENPQIFQICKYLK